MMKFRIVLCLFSLFAFALPASAASIESRTEAINAQLQGNNSYQADLARELASVAQEEKDQHDVNVARTFMNMAEEHAAQAGGSK